MNNEMQIYSQWALENLTVGVVKFYAFKKNLNNNNRTYNYELATFFKIGCKQPNTNIDEDDTNAY
jgi:hypothetical protein